MPLSALVNGERRIASFLKGDEWQSLKNSKPSIKLCCCGSKGFMRLSKLGTQHFVHLRKPQTCTSGPETDLHLQHKSVVASAIQEAGWTADVEVSDFEHGWRADVMATRGKVRVAFEIQLAPIDLAELKRRQEKYTQSGVHGCWFYGESAVKNSSRDLGELPAFPLKDTGIVSIGSKKLALNKAVFAWLRGEFRFRSGMRLDMTRVVLFYRFSRCWRCGNEFDIYLVSEESKTCQDQDNEDDDSEPGFEVWSVIEESAKPWIARRVERYLQEHSDAGLCVSFPRFQRAEGSGRQYYGFRCVHCGALIGREVFEQILEYGFCSQDASFGLERVGRLELDHRTEIIESQHWCFSKAHKFCSEAGEPQEPGPASAT